MHRQAFVLMAAAFLLVSGVAVSAQESPGGAGDHTPGQQQPPADQDHDGMMGGGMMGRGMMGGDHEGARSGTMGGMMHGGMMGHMMRSGMMGHMMGGGTPPVMMRVVFALVDSNGDGALSLEEFQAAQERIFKAMDANRDGKLTPKEMYGFMHGRQSAP